MIIESEITSLDELLEVLPRCKPDDYRAIAKGMHIDAADFIKYTSWGNSRYTRNCIVRTDAYELLLLCWEQGQETAVHCHGGEECWVYNVQGVIQEVHYEMEAGVPVETNTEELSAGGLSYMNDDLGYHKLINAAKGRSMTLHLYMNPIDHCTSWNSKLKKFVPVSPSYDTVCGEPVQ